MDAGHLHRHGRGVRLRAVDRVAESADQFAPGALDREGRAGEQQAEHQRRHDQLGQDHEHDWQPPPTGHGAGERHHQTEEQQRSEVGRGVAGEATPRQHGDPRGASSDHRHRQAGGQASAGFPHSRASGGASGVSIRFFEDWALDPPELGPDSLEAVTWSQRGAAPPLLGQHGEGATIAGSRRPPGLDVKCDCQRCGRVVLHPAEYRHVELLDVAHHSDGQPAVGLLGQPAGVELDLGDGLHDGERFQQRSGAAVRLAGVPRAGRVLASGGDQPHGEAAMSEVDRDRGHRGDCSLQRGGDALAAVCADPVVQEEGCPRLPWLLFSTHHQLAQAGRAAPVHPPEIVAAAVLAHRDVLGRTDGERTRPVVTGSCPAATQRDGRERDSAGGDGERHGGPERSAELDQPERITDPHRHRPDLEVTADVGAHLVAHVPLPAVADALEHEARPGAEHVRHVVLQQQYAAGRPTLVGQGEVDVGRLAGGDQLRADGADQSADGSGCGR